MAREQVVYVVEEILLGEVRSRIGVGSTLEKAKKLVEARRKDTASLWEKYLEVAKRLGLEHARIEELAEASKTELKWLNAYNYHEAQESDLYTYIIEAAVVDDISGWKRLRAQAIHEGIRNDSRRVK